MRGVVVVVDEAHRVMQTGLEMIDIIREVREASEDQNLKNLDMRIGIHTGRRRVNRVDKLIQKGINSKICDRF